MTIQQGQVISHNDYNNIKSKVDAVYGTGTGDTGYGQSVTSPTKNQGDTISKFEWDALRHDMVACRQHQTGSTVGTSTANDGSNLVVVTQTTPITYAITHQYDNFADVITSDRFLIPLSGQSTDTTVEQTVASEWNGTINHEVTYSATSDQFRFFFNAGGQVATSINLGMVMITSTKDTFWYDLFNQIGVVWMTYTATGTNGGGTGSSIGYYDLTSSDQLIYQINGYDVTGYSGTEFSSNSYKVYARKTSTTLTITVSISDTDTAGTDINVTVLPTSIVYQRRPTGSNVSVTALSVSSNTISGGSPVPQCYVTPNITTVCEGMDVIFTVNTQYIANGTTLYWGIQGGPGITGGDFFVVPQLSGSFIINNNTATITIPILSDGIVESDEQFVLQIFYDTNGTTFGPPSNLVYISANGVYSWNTPGTYDWIVPAGVTSVQMDLIGGGGSGTNWVGEYGQPGSSNERGMPGNIVSSIVTLTPGETITITVGAAGYDSDPGWSVGGSGGDSIVTRTIATYTAAGGAYGDGVLGSAGSLNPSTFTWGSTIGEGGTGLNSQNSYGSYGATSGAVYFRIRQTFVLSTAGTSSWIVPAHISTVTISAIGAGGAGYGTHDSGYCENGYPGGIGGAVQGIDVAVVESGVFSFTVGTRGGPGGYFSTGAPGTATVITFNGTNVVSCGQGSQPTDKTQGSVTINTSNPLVSGGTLITGTGGSTTSGCDGYPYNTYDPRSYAEHYNNYSVLGSFNTIIDSANPHNGLAEFDGLIKIVY